MRAVPPPTRHRNPVLYKRIAGALVAAAVICIVAGAYSFLTISRGGLFEYCEGSSFRGQVLDKPGPDLPSTYRYTAFPFGIECTYPADERGEAPLVVVNDVWSAYIYLPPVLSVAAIALAVIAHRRRP